MSEFGVAQFTLRIGDGHLQAKAMIPAGPMAVDDIAVIAHGLADSMAVMATKQAEAEGKAVSCKAGCGACCRQMAPVSEHEARQLLRLVEAMPPQRIETLRTRFKEGIEKLRDAGIIEKVANFAALPAVEDRVNLGVEYFKVGVPCPFLEDESCSIYEHRPTRCREYVVTSDPKHCADPSPDTIHRIPVPMKPSNALFQFGDGGDNRRIVILPLILALDWAAAQPAQPEPALSGPQLLQNFLVELEKL